MIPEEKPKDNFSLNKKSKWKDFYIPIIFLACESDDVEHSILIQTILHRK